MTGLIVGGEDQRRAWDEARAYLETQSQPVDEAGIGFYMSLNQLAVQRLLRRPKVWQTVQAVAEALIQQGTIEEEALDALLTATYGQRRRAKVSA